MAARALRLTGLFPMRQRKSRRLATAAKTSDTDKSESTSKKTLEAHPSVKIEGGHSAAPAARSTRGSSRRVKQEPNSGGIDETFTGKRKRKSAARSTAARAVKKKQKSKTSGVKAESKPAEDATKKNQQPNKTTTKTTPKKKKKRKSPKKPAFDAEAVIANNPKLLEKAKEIAKILMHLYPEPPIPLNHFDAFSLLVAVVLSAQTTDGKVNEVTDILFEKCPDPKSLSEMEYNDLLAIVRSVGLAPTKSKNLIKMSQMLLDEFGGKVPNTFEELERLPGVGHKTASVVMSQAFGLESFAVDTHIHRLAVRWGLAKEGSDVKKVEAMLRALFPKSSWGKLHLQMIYFGREWCQAKRHERKSCPICCWASYGKKIAPIRLSEINGMTALPKASKRIILYTERIEDMRAFKAKFGRSLAAMDED